MMRPHKPVRAGACAAAAVTLLALFGIGLAARASEEQGADPRFADGSLERAVEENLKIDEGVESHLIDVTVRDGIVTLSGSVDNLLSNERAGRVARRVKGVRSVVNRIDVIPSARSDAQIREEVEGALLDDPATDAYELGVDVKDGTVSLTGTVESWAEKRLSGQVAKGVRGVQDVVNEIEIRYTMTRSDSEILNDVERRLDSDIWVGAEEISVEVDQGRVALIGTVSSAAEKRTAIGDAWVSGVEEVDHSDLRVDVHRRDRATRSERSVGRSDDEVEHAVRDALRHDPRVSSVLVELFVDDGVVTLTGEVDNLEAKRAAERDASNTVGVWRVRNYMRVRPEEPPSDEELLTRLERALKRDSVTERLNVVVTVRNGKAYLYGEVDTQFQYRQVGNVASAVNGVIDVVNLVDVDLDWKPEKNDWEIQADVENQLWWSPFVDGEQIDVDVEEGIAILTGTVETWHERSVAAENAYEAGARSVVNNLKVRYGPDYYLP